VLASADDAISEALLRPVRAAAAGSPMRSAPTPSVGGFFARVPAARDRRCDRLPPFGGWVLARLPAAAGSPMRSAPTPSVGGFVASVPAARDRRCDRLLPLR